MVHFTISFQEAAKHINELLLVGAVQKSTLLHVQLRIFGERHVRGHQQKIWYI